jgi:hypothetical protein
MPPRGHLLHPRQGRINDPVARCDVAHVVLYSDDGIAGLNQIIELSNKCARWDVACGLPIFPSQSPAFLADSLARLDQSLSPWPWATAARKWS